MLQEKNTLLRPLSLADLDEIMLWINDQEVNQYVGRVLPMNREAESAWISALAQNKNDIVFGICCVNEKSVIQLIGTCGLHRINWIDRRAVTGIAIGNKAYWEKGIGSIAFRLLIKYAFLSLNLHRLSSSAIAFNDRSIALHKRCGFTLEGVSRRAVSRHDQYYDLINFGLLRDEFLKIT